MFAVNVVNDSYGIWTSLKMVLTPLNVNRYWLLKLTALTIKDLHSPTIHCPLNVNGLLHKESVEALTVRWRTVNALTIFCPAMDRP
jgi:hypothetical protein